MPDLPTLTVTNAQAQRLLEAFDGMVDPETGAPLTPVQAYKQWLRDRLVAHVLATEGMRLDQAAAATRRAVLQELAESLPARPTTPPA